MSLRCSLPGVITAVFVAGLAVAQTTPQPAAHEHATRSSDFTTQAGRADEVKPLKLAGCLMRRQDVPASGDGSAGPRVPLEGYLLVAVRTTGGHGQSLGGMRPTPAQGVAAATHDHEPKPTGNSGSSNDATGQTTMEDMSDTQMFKLVGLPVAQLEALRGKRVEVLGRIDTAAVVDMPRESTRRPYDADDAAPFVATSVRQLDGPCSGEQSGPRR
jgi:hypothetical protein